MTTQRQETHRFGSGSPAAVQIAAMKPALLLPLRWRSDHDTPFGLGVSWSQTVRSGVPRWGGPASAGAADGLVTRRQRTYDAQRDDLVGEPATTVDAFSDP